MRTHVSEREVGNVCQTNASWLHTQLVVLCACGDFFFFYGLGPMCFCLTAVRVDESAQFKQPLIIDVSVMGGLPGDRERGALQAVFMIPVYRNERGRLLHGL